MASNLPLFDKHSEQDSSLSLFDKYDRPVETDAQTGYTDAGRFDFDQQDIQEARMRGVDLTQEVARLESSQERIRQAQERKPKGRLPMETAVTLGLPTIDPMTKLGYVANLPKRISETTLEEQGLTPEQLALGAASSYADLASALYPLVASVGPMTDIERPPWQQQPEQPTKELTEKAGKQLKEAIEFGETQSFTGRFLGDIGVIESPFIAQATGLARSKGLIPASVKTPKPKTGEIMAGADVTPEGEFIDLASGTVRPAEEIPTISFNRHGKDVTGEIVGETKSSYKVDIGQSKPVNVSKKQKHTITDPQKDVVGEVINKPASFLEDGRYFSEKNFKSKSTNKQWTQDAINDIASGNKTGKQVLDEMFNVSKKVPFMKKVMDTASKALEFGKGIMDETFVNPYTGVEYRGWEYIKDFDEMINGHINSVGQTINKLEELTNKTVIKGGKKITTKVPREKTFNALKYSILKNLEERATKQAQDLMAETKITFPEALEQAQLPDGLTYNEVQGAIKELEDTRNILVDKETMSIVNGLRSLLDEQAEYLVKEGILDKDKLFDAYIPHQVNSEAVSNVSLKGKPGFLKKAKGSQKSIKVMEDPFNALLKHMSGLERFKQNRQFLQRVVEKFGSPYDPNIQLPEGYRPFRLPDFEDFYMGTIAPEEALVNQIADIASAAVKNQEPAQKAGRVIVLPEAIANNLDELLKPKAFKDDLGGMVGKGVRDLTSFFKSNVTYSGYNPLVAAFHFRNMLGDMRMYARGLMNADITDPGGRSNPHLFSPKVLRAASKVVSRRKDPTKLGIAIDEMLGSDDVGKLVDIGNEQIGTGNFTGNDIIPLSQGWSPEFFAEYGSGWWDKVKGSKVGGALSKWDRKIKDLGAQREEYMRVAQYIADRAYGVKGAKPLDPVAAHINNGNIFINYNHLTGAEREFRNLLFPFYTFYKKDLSRAIRQWAKDPAKQAAAMLTPVVATTAWNMMIDPDYETALIQSGMYNNGLHVILPWRDSQNNRMVMVLNTDDVLEQTTGIGSIAKDFAVTGTTPDFAKRSLGKIPSGIGRTLFNTLNPYYTKTPLAMIGKKAAPYGVVPITQKQFDEDMIGTTVDYVGYLTETLHPQAMTAIRRLGADKPVGYKILDFTTGVFKQGPSEYKLRQRINRDR